ncbi:MAG: exodeoxyribonuclease VII large subunit [Candidatus Nanopelagicales bacterium]
MAGSGSGHSSDDPMPVRVASRHVSRWIAQLGQIWVEGQITQMRERRTMVYLTLRDPDADLSIPVATTATAARAARLTDGQRVVARLKLNYYDGNGSLSWRASQFQAVGLGALMQQLEHLRRTLAQEGLFRPEHKQPLPLLPRRIGLICGRNSAAQRDVEVNARARWPHVLFEVREVAVQGTSAVADVVTALVELDSHDEVDVIVVTRGGGSFEDLLAFSNETLVRAVFAARTPVVSAIGHEEDTPLLDLVADQRASTPTDAGKIVVPDLGQELTHLRTHRRRLHQLVSQQVERQRLVVGGLTARPVMRGPGQVITGQRAAVSDGRRRSRRALAQRVHQERTAFETTRRHPALARPERRLEPLRQDLGLAATALRRDLAARLRNERNAVAGVTAQLRTLSPQATLDRGYAVLRDSAGTPVDDSRAVTPGDLLEALVARGRFSVTVADVPPEEQ